MEDFQLGAGGGETLTRRQPLDVTAKVKFAGTRWVRRSFFKIFGLILILDTTGVFMTVIMRLTNYYCAKSACFLGGSIPCGFYGWQKRVENGGSIVASLLFLFYSMILPTIILISMKCRGKQSYKLCLMSHVSSFWSTNAL